MTPDTPPPPPRVLEVGNCDPDHAALCTLLAGFDAEVHRAATPDQALAALQAGTYRLVLVNRVFDSDGTDALPLIQRIKSDRRFREVPVMMISNHPDAQDRAVAAGAIRGFGKADLHDPQTRALLKPHLTVVSP